MTLYVFALLIGVVAGMRAMTAPAAVSWAAALGWLSLEGTPLAFLGFKYTPWIFTALALVELVADQLPKTPSRKVPVQFGTRLLSGGLAGAAIGAGQDQLVGGLIAGVVGAVIGTLGGYEARSRLVKATGGRDFPIALLEDAVAIGGAYLIVTSLA